MMPDHITVAMYAIGLLIFYDYNGLILQCRRECDLVDRALDWHAADPGSLSNSATDLLCDHGEVMSLNFSVPLFP